MTCKRPNSTLLFNSFHVDQISIHSPNCIKCFLLEFCIIINYKTIKILSDKFFSFASADQKHNDRSEMIKYFILNVKFSFSNFFLNKTSYLQSQLSHICSLVKVLDVIQCL